MHCIHVDGMTRCIVYGINSFEIKYKCYKINLYKINLYKIKMTRHYDTKMTRHYHTKMTRDIMIQKCQDINITIELQNAQNHEMVRIQDINCEKNESTWVIDQ